MKIENTAAPTMGLVVFFRGVKTNSATTTKRGRKDIKSLARTLIKREKLNFKAHL